METITVNCEDYMHILSNTPIVNSPFYDGMIMFYAAKDIAFRGGIKEVVRDWTSLPGITDDEYFLPSGFAFTKPVVRFESSQMLFDCLMYMVKRPEAFIFFDEEGKLHVKKLPGGLFSLEAEELAQAEFTRDPDDDDKTLILDEKVVDYDLNSTVNRISIFTLDRDTRNAVIYTRSATADEDNLLYRRIFLYDQAALGSYEVAVTYAEDLAERIFYPIRKSSFKSVGKIETTGTDQLYPLDFVLIDGDEFRLMSISRKYDANSNDFVVEYNAEWLGG